MKKVIAIVVSLLFVLSVAGLSIAAEEKKAPAPAKVEEKKAPAPAAAPAPAKAEEKKAEKKAPAKVMSVSGEVTAVDAKANTLTVKGKKGDVMLTADDKTTVKIGKDKKSLGDVKAGDKATVKYSEADGKNVAKSIAVTAAKKAEAPKAEEKKKEAAPAAAPKAEEKKK